GCRAVRISRIATPPGARRRRAAPRTAPPAIYLCDLCFLLRGSAKEALRARLRRAAVAVDAQCDDGLDAGGAACGGVAGRERDAGEERQRGEQGDGIGRLDAEEQRRRGAAGGERERDADRGADSQQQGPLRQGSAGRPTASRIVVSRRISRARAARPAPSAMRTPISLVRRVTV